MVLLSDVTMQVRSRKAFEESAHRVALILESLPQIAWTTDRDGKTNYLNSQWYMYTLDTPPKGESSTNRFNFQEYLHAEDVAPLLTAWQTCFNQGERFEHEYRLRRGSDGKYRWMLGRTVPLRDEAGNITMWVGTSTDIDDVKRAEQQLQSLNEQLAASNEELSQANWQMQQANATLSRVNADLDTFVYTASHDLKAPILNIEGLLKALQRELGKDRPQVETINHLYHLLYSSVNRFKATISDLTDVARISKESQEDVSLVSIAQVLEEVRLDLADQIREAGARLECVLDCPPIPFSRKNLKSVLYNLLSNAIKYHSPERVAVVQITCLTQPEYLLLTVEDNGLGMDMRHEEKIFALFKRLHAHVEGTGIGLYIVKKMIEQAGGRIEVESQVGVGSTFRVYFRR
jgi:signal transduction histidine kinase